MLLTLFVAYASICPNMNLESEQIIDLTLSLGRPPMKKLEPTKTARVQ